ncbi:MAG: hypothetical protein RQ729_08315, partial [Wenzhouxiangellaceae bacterium]|nr:hypothetical protein [Wenzhouxiangellaceae bacterium]
EPRGTRGGVSGWAFLPTFVATKVGRKSLRSKLRNGLFGYFFREKSNSLKAGAAGGETIFWLLFQQKSNSYQRSAYPISRNASAISSRIAGSSIVAGTLTS